MTEAAFDAAALAPLDDIELEFDDVAPIAPALPAVPSKKPRRAPAKGRDAAAEAPAPAAELPPSAAPERAAVEEPADPSAPVPQPGDVSVGSISPDRRQWMLAAIVCFALFTSLMSLGGLIAVSRTLGAARADRDHAQDDRAALAHVPELVAALDRASARLAVPAGAAPAPLAALPAGGVTSDDLHHSLDALRLAIDARQPTGVGAMAGTLQAGFSELDTRLDRIETRLPPPAVRARPDPKAR